MSFVDQEVRANMVTVAVAALGLTMQEAERYADQALPVAKALAKYHNISAGEAVARILREIHAPPPAETP